MISIEPIAAPLGAIAHDLDPTAPLEAPVAAGLIEALSQHGVVVIRSGQLSAAELVAFGRALGRPEHMVESTLRHVEHPEIAVLGNLTDTGALAAIDSAQVTALQRRRQWQTEGSFQATPTRFTVAYASHVPTRGGQSQFADMRKALRLLPPQDRGEIAELQLVHEHGQSRSEHPWIRIDGSGQAALYMGAHASTIVGRDRDQSRQWFAEIEAQLPVHDVIYEHQWRRHDVLVWDNHITMQRVLGYDIEREARVVHQLNIAASE